MYAKRKAAAKLIAQQYMNHYMNYALELYDRDANLAQHYVESARRMGMRFRVRLEKKWKLQLCLRCKRLNPGLNSRVRLHSKRSPHISIVCLACGGVKRIPI